MRTRRQLDVIAAVSIHKQAGQENHGSTDTHMQTDTVTNNRSVYILSSADKRPLILKTGAGVCAQTACQKLP